MDRSNTIVLVLTALIAALPAAAQIPSAIGILRVAVQEPSQPTEEESEKLSQDQVIDVQHDLEPFIPPWTSLLPPSEEALKLLAPRINNFNGSMVRELPYDAIDAVLMGARSMGASMFDLFTARRFRELNRELYYVSQETLARLDEKYDFNGLTPVTRQIPQDEELRRKYKDYPDYRMQALVLGDNAVRIIYNQEKSFYYYHPDLPDYYCKAYPTVVQTINGPNDMSVKGILIMGLVPVQRFARLRPLEPGGRSRALIETLLKTVIREVSPLQLRGERHVVPPVRADPAQTKSE